MQTDENYPSNIDIDEVKFIVKIREEGDLVATAIFEYRNLKIKGFRVVRSKFENEYGDKLWIQVPSYQTGRFFHKMFFLEDETKQCWKNVEKKLLDEYKKKDKEYYSRKLGISDSS
jgi:hypothetical protein